LIAKVDASIRTVDRDGSYAAFVETIRSALASAMEDAFGTDIREIGSKRPMIEHWPKREKSSEVESHLRPSQQFTISKKL
jgi:hypothetical protein